jgi:uncharacterized protein (DUF58 family)
MQLTTTDKARHVPLTLADLLALQASAADFDLTQLNYTSLQHANGVQISRLRGRGIEFSESRVYQPGDDIRHIDWRVSARRGKTHSKVFQEEKAQHVVIAVDYSASLFFGTRVTFKSVIAAKLATLLSFNAIEHRKLVSSLLLSGEQVRIFPLANNMQQQLPLIKSLCDQSYPIDNKHANYQLLLKQLAQQQRHGCTICLISDFAYCQPSDLQLLADLSLRNTCYAFAISDPFEQQLPSKHVYQLSQADQHLTLNGYSDRLRYEYQTHFANHRQLLKHTLANYAIPLLDFSTTDNLALVLRQRFNNSRGLYASV